MSVWTLTFDGLPLGPNDRMSRYEKAQFMAVWRQVAQLRAQEARIPALPSIRISAVIYRRALGVADEDNDRARLKPLLDGIVDAGVVPKDTRKYVSWGQVLEARGTARVVLTIEGDPPASESAIPYADRYPPANRDTNLSAYLPGGSKFSGAARASISEEA